MASELSHLIEMELKHKGYTAQDLVEEGGVAGLPAASTQDQAAPHQALMGALRVEVSCKLSLMLSLPVHLLSAFLHTASGLC